MTRQHERTGADPVADPLAAWAAFRGAGGWLYSLYPGGARAYDAAEHVLYTATIDDAGRLVAVVVTVPADSLGARVDVARAGQALAAFIEATPKPEPGAKPTDAEVADMLAEGWDRHRIAAHYGRPVATVDRWIRQARAFAPDRTPPARRGLAASARLLKAGASAPADPMRIETPEPNPASGKRGESPTTRGKNR